MNPLGNQHEQVPSDGEHGQHGHDESGPQAMFFIFFGLLFSCILRQVNKKTGIPYTPMLLVIGIIFGYCRHSLGTFGESISIISTMSPHMILFVFIPVLLFESAFNCDWHVFRKSMVNILLLAAPGVLWGAFIIAFMFKGILGYGEEDLTWYEALALGCVLSATDPVAVVALLKELGASIHFNHLVEGESLLNDGTAMVFFMLFMGLVKGEATSALGVLTNFIRVSIGGPLLGIVFGLIICWWMKKIIRDTVLSVVITFVGTYLCFYVAEYTWVKVSGILSIVSLGLLFSAVGKRKIYPESEHALHSVWSTIQYGSQSLIFVLTGIIVGIKMIDETTITVGDWLKMFFFWILMIISRVIMVLTFYPLLKRFGYGLTQKQLVVLIYGGLRGALGMCLSLFVCVDQSLRIRFRQLTVFYMCGMAMLTIVVNGLTCSKLVGYLQMIRVPEIKEKLLKRCIKKVLDSTQAKLKELKSDLSLSYAKWKIVQSKANVKEFGGTFHERVSRISKMQRGGEYQMRDSLKEINRTDIVEEIRFRFTRFLSRILWQYYEQGELSEDSVALLNSMCSIANDEVNVKLRYFDLLSSFFDLDSISWYLNFKSTPLIGEYCTRSAIHKIYYIYEASSVFIEACQQVIDKFEDEFPIQNQHLRYVLDEVRQNIEHAETYISELENTYPKIIQAVHTERATTILLKNKKNELKHLYQAGYIDQQEYAQLRKQIDQTITQIKGSNVRLDEIKFSEVFAHCPLFSTLTPQEIIDIRMKAKEKSYPKGAPLFRKDSQLKVATIIISGSVREQFKDEYGKFYLIRSVGSVLDAYDFTYKEAAKCEAKARNNIRVLEIQDTIITELLNSNSQFKKKWFKSLFLYCVHIHPGIETIQKNLTDKEMRRFVQASEVCLLNNNTTIDVPSGAFVFLGQVVCDNNTYVKGNYVPRSSIIKSLTSNTIILKFAAISRKTERMSIINEHLEEEMH